MRTLDDNYYEPEWSDCSDPNDPDKCVVYTWWRKKCNNKKKKANGEAKACRSRFLYKHDIEPNLYIVNNDECSTNEHTCHKNAICTDIVQGYKCACKSGFDGDGADCVDVDECVTGIHDCDQNATCKNTNGGFECKCAESFKGDGRNCVNLKESEDICQQTPLPDFVNIVSHKAKKTRNGYIYRVKCDNGRDIVPEKPGQINRLS